MNLNTYFQRREIHVKLFQLRQLQTQNVTATSINLADY